MNNQPDPMTPNPDHARTQAADAAAELRFAIADGASDEEIARIEGNYEWWTERATATAS